ncbi:glutathione-disulfide reductase [Candidatus Synechococcus calcipolaris G9]|uniref:Glutathione reductase n=1 Tax=Candidatus Synechococcus calcipolaris G9 TaxID=1497997 RepID=A0ABT6F1H0_9SYNE|nr:glutathione-disulfide reductase [Candidatus Synechococcus calcipolaris]MDG2991633.1 glutathione-disulfide reductase [Candidatus Synechococcus calcipolaris G9]
MSYDYDLFVIGAGSGGLAASKRAASYGAKVAIAEADKVGGTCVIRGCVPKKLLVYASKFSHLYHDAEGYGWREVDPKLNWQKLIKAVDNEVNRLSQLHIGFLAKAGVELMPLRASLVDDHTLELHNPQNPDQTPRRVTAAKILIAVGGEAIKPKVPGIEHSITSREMFLLPKKPKRIAILGAGYISVEFAGIMKGLGSEVIHLIRGDRPLRGFDIDVQEGIYQGMVNHGIDVRGLTSLTSLQRTKKGNIRVAYERDGEESVIKVDTVLCAIGRSPKLSGLGLENAGIQLKANERGIASIAVDEYSRTNQAHIFAVGDCTDRVNLTPVAIAEGRAFADTEFGNNPRSVNYDNIPSAVFSQPEAASVGLTEAQAKAKLGEDKVKVYRASFRPMFHSLTGANEKVMVKLVVEQQTEWIMGVHMVGDYAAEIIQGMAIAVKMGATKKDFDATIGIHPSTAEEFVTLR